MLLEIRSRWWQAGLVAMTAVLVLGATTVWAGHDDGPGEGFTGCLNISSGSLQALAVGDDPLRPCSGVEVQIHLGNGDITAVQAGTGLSGGGSSGSVTLSLDGAYQLPQDCDAGEVAKSDAAGHWQCAGDQDTQYDGSDFALSDQPCAAGEVVIGISATGTVTCAPDQDTQYSGIDFALSNQSCGAGQFVTAIAADGTLTCTSVLSAGDYNITIDVAGITISGPGGSIALNPGGISIQGTLITLNGSNCGIARLGDSVTGSTVYGGGALLNGTIASGSITVLTGGNC